MNKYLLYHLLLIPHFVFSQESESKIKIKIEVAASYSHTGLNTLVGASVSKNNNELSIGMRTPVASFSAYNSIPFVGIYLDYNRDVSEKNKINYLVNMHYGNLFREFNSPLNDTKALFQIHELYIGYGLRCEIKKLHITNTINYGGYMEKQLNFYTNKPTVFFHGGALIKISLTYAL